MGVPICWKSKAQRSVTLSSSESEFVALAEAAKEAKFVVMLLQSMGIPVQLPVTIRVDNVGAIYMAENVNTSNRTKHVDVRWNYVREFLSEPDPLMRIVFVRSENNTSDGFTKNTTGDVYWNHAVKFVVQRSEIEEANESSDRQEGC